jgi:hypothetical protein
MRMPSGELNVGVDGQPFKVSKSVLKMFCLDCPSKHAVSFHRRGPSWMSWLMTTGPTLGGGVTEWSS